MAFSTGTARLARMLQCPIIVCVPIVSPQGEAILKWGPIIRAPDTDDQIFDVGVTNKLLDIIEKEIALRPDQYVIEFMGPRHWNEQVNKWEK
jgi:lauroyl/myristoyl acyltransferase